MKIIIIGALVLLLGIFMTVKPSWFAVRGQGIKNEQDRNTRYTGVIVIICAVIGLGITISKMVLK